MLINFEIDHWLSSLILLVNSFMCKLMIVSMHMILILGNAWHIYIYILIICVCTLLLTIVSDVTSRMTRMISFYFHKSNYDYYELYSLANHSNPIQNCPLSNILKKEKPHSNSGNYWIEYPHTNFWTSPHFLAWVIDQNYKKMIYTVLKYVRKFCTYLIWNKY